MSAAAIVALEAALDERLQDHAAIWRSSAPWLGPARQWSAAVWDRAAELGPVTLPPETIARGLALAARPVFVCGAHRSGTSLLRNLLDGHPALVVLPAEGSFYTGLERRLGMLGEAEQAAEMGREWLRRLANPTSQPPFWLLGRSTPEHSPYVEFARSLAAWWPILRERAAGARGTWALAAVALAYAGHAGGAALAPGLAHWVEKTPTNEAFLAQLWAEFPEAKVIQVIRRPEAALASRKAVMTMAGRWRPGRTMAAVFGDLARSYRVARAQSRSAPADRYLLLRYEQLAGARDDACRALARFLGIDNLPLLAEPTVAGQPASRNSSFGDGGQASLTRSERALLALTAERAAAALGY